MGVSRNGRAEITTNATEITRDNVVAELTAALETHEINCADIDYLYKYYKGNHEEVQGKTKQFNTEINNKITVNRAAEIVDFKTGFLLSEPVQYIGRDETANVDELNTLNDYFYRIGKQQQDMELLDWLHICGTAIRIILPEKTNYEYSPFRSYVLDPRYSFVVYRSDLEHRRMFGVKYISAEPQGAEDDILDADTAIYSVWTENAYFEIQDGVILKEEARYYGAVPLIEYKANLPRMGAFENVLPLLDAIDLMESNRADAIQQFVEAIMVFKNCDIDDESFKHLKELGGIKVPEGGDVSYLVQELNQTQTQTFIDDMYDAVLTICGIPGRNGANGASTSDTGAATLLRNGWQSATTYAAKTVSYFTQSEKEMLNLALTFIGNTLNIGNIDIKFPFKNYQNSYEQAQILTLMLQGSGMKIHPQLAFTYCGVFPDAMQAYEMSKQYTEQTVTNSTVQSEEDYYAKTENTDGAVDGMSADNSGDIEQ